MVEQELEIFADGLARCFKKFANETAVIGTPFLANSYDDHLHDYTGCIHVSGSHAGSVYFTASERLLKNLLWAMEVLDSSKEALRDLVGEIGNIVSGSAREKFGDTFFISPPTIEDLEMEKVFDEMKLYVIPVNWRSLRANLIVDLK